MLSRRNGLFYKPAFSFSLPHSAIMSSHELPLLTPPANMPLCHIYPSSTHGEPYSYNYRGPRESCGWNVAVIVLRCPGICHYECSVSIQDRTLRFSPSLRA